MLIFLILLPGLIFCFEPIEVANSLIFKVYLNIREEDHVNQYFHPEFQHKNCSGEHRMSKTEIIENSKKLNRIFVENKSDRSFFRVFDAKFDADHDGKLHFKVQNKKDFPKYFEVYAEQRKQMPPENMINEQDGWMFMWQSEVCYCN
ncbi:unnamed protein product [Caenorhabditis angaria]|uniref:Uncharacterized protein n=1 Tax=Caenorhabditis angaria TaxID=860376 RepID=A0A9P1N2C8_9PELO|nr:unnamed protein product [Caenorhabditis angaria]